MEHPRYAHVDPITRLAGDDIGTVNARRGPTNQAKVSCRFQLRIRRHGKFGRVLDERAIIRSAVCSLMQNCAIDRAALGPINTPLSGRGGDKHFARAGCRLAKNFPTAAQAPAAAGTQVLEIGTRRGLHDGDARPIGSQFVSQNHRKGGTDTLTHFRFADGERDHAILIDLNPAIGPEFTAIAQRCGVN